MAKEVSVGVKVKLEADAKEMQRIIDDLESRLSNIKPGTSLEKTLTKQLQQLKAQAGDFSLISGQQIINQSDLATAANIAKRFFRDVGRVSDSYEKAPFSSLQFTDDQLKNLKKAEKALEDFKTKSKDSLSKKTTGEVFGKYAEDAKKIQQTSAKLQKSFAMDDSFEETKKRIQKSKEQAEKDVELTNKKLTLKRDEKLAAESAKKTAEANFNQKKAELAKTYKLEESLQKKADLAKNVSKQKQFKSQKEVKDFFDKELFTSSGAFKAGGQDKANQLLSWMGFKPEEIPAEAAKLKQKIRDEIINAPLSQSQEMANKMQAGAKKFLDKDYTKAVKDNETLIKKDQGYIEAEKALKNSESTLNKKASEVDTLQTNLSTQQLIYQQIQQLEAEIDSLWQKLEGDEAAGNKTELEKLKQNVRTEEENLKKQVQNNYTKQDKDAAAKINQNTRGYKDSEDARLQAEQEAAQFKANLQSGIKHWMGAQQVITLVRQGIRQAYQDIQGLDKAMTNIAVVTDFNVSDLWGKINDYMQVAQQYGVTTQGVYEVSQLYFQQGLGEADTMAATTETLKMARIAGMDYAEAADGMTVAIRGFNMEMQDAARVTDVYSKVAAITASDTQELVTAMSKTASSAAAVGSSFENTTAMLAVMIEATRESPQNLGSALKSIISRYGEMTKGVDVDEEGEEIDYNRVDTALKTVGISLKDAQGQFRDFDTVIEELSAKWTTLDSVTQRYIATIFAGNRQQSRFLALVSNYDRYMEVSEAAANSEDAGLLQYSKTLDSLETKLNNIKTSFQQFYMDIFDGPTVGKVLEFINDLIKGFNKLGKITSIINIASIIGAVKVVGTVLVSHFATTFSQIANAWKSTLKDMSTQTQNEGQIAGQKWYQGFVNKSGNGKATLSQKGTKVVSGAMLLGSGLTMFGSSIAEKDQTAGAWLSAGGNALSIGAQLAMINPYLGIIGGLVAGLVTLFTSLPTDLEKAQQELEKNSKKAEEANIKRAEAKEKARGMESTIQELKELERTQYDSVEAQKAYIDAQNSAAETYPELVTTFDLAGNAIIDTIAAENNLAKAREQAAEAAYEAAAAERQKKLSEQAENWEQLWAASGIGTSNLSKYEGEDVRNSSYFIAGLMGTGLTKQIASLTGQEASFSGDLTAQDPEIVKALGISSGISEEFFNLISSTKNLSLPEILAQFDQAFQNGVLDFLFEIPQIEGMSDADKEKMRTALYENAVTNFLSSSKLIGEGETAQTYRDRYLPNLQALSSNQAAIEGSNEGVVAQYLNKKLETTFLNEGNRFGKWQEGFENADLRLIAAITDKINPQELKYDSTGKIADTTSIDAVYDSTVQTFTNFYDSIASSFNTEKFNELIQQGEIGKVTSAEFIDQFQNLTGLNQEQIEANEAANSYLTAFTEWQSQVFSRAQTSLTQDSRKINWEEVMPEGESLTSFLEQIPGYYYTEIIDFANYIDKQLESGTLSNNQAKDIVTAYAGLWSSLDDSALGLTPEQLGQARAILEKADFTSIEGITNLIDELSKLGIDTSKINFKIGEDTFNIADFPIYTSNLISEWENLKNKLVTNTESLIKDLQNASQGMSLEDALSMAKKMNLDLGEDFQFIDGEWFTTNTAAIETYYTEKANEYKAQLLKEATRAQEKLGSMDQSSYDSFLSGGKTNLSEEDLEVYNLLEKYWTEDTKKYYDKWLKIDGNSQKGMAGFWSDYFASLGEDVDDATQKALEYYKEQADKEAKIATDGANLRTKAKNAGVDFDAIEARETIKSKGKYGYSPEEIASLQEALGLVEGVDYSLNTKTGSYDFTDVGLDKVGSEIRQVIELSAQQEAEAALDSLADLGSSIGSGEAKASDYAEAFSYLTEVRGYTAEQVKNQITSDYLKEDQKALKIRFARQASYMATGSINNWEDYMDEAEEAVEEFNANMADSTNESVVKYYDLLQKKILGTITNQELEELEDFKPADLGLDTTEFTGNLISQLTQHAQAIIDGLASGTIVDFEAATDTLEKDMTAALSAKAYAKEFNIDENLIEGMDSLTLAYFSDAMETVRKSKNQFDADSAGKIATSIATMMGAGEEVASKVLDLFAYDLEEHSFSLELPSSFDELKEAFGLEENGAAATAIEQAYANQQKQVAYARKGQNRTGMIAGALSMTDVKAFTRGTFEQAEEAIKNDASLSEEAKQKALAEVQALRYFWEVAGEAEISGELEKFDESRAFIDGLKSTYETLASGEEITAAELKEIYEGLGQELDEGETYQDIIKQGPEAVLNNIIETIRAAAESGNISQNEAAEQLAELQAIVLDAIISNISSGISSLGEGIEGTLSNQDWNSLIEKYSGLKDADVTRTIKGVKLSDSAQLQLATAQYSEALSKGASGWDFAEQLWEVAEGADSAFGSIESIEEALANATGESKKLLQQLLNIAMLDEDDPLFNFMEQDATKGKTKNFDNFVNQIDKVKSVFSSFQSGEAIGYQDFYNMMDFMDQQSGGALSDFSQTIDSEVMPGLAKLQSYLKASGHSYEDFVNSVVANTDQWGKVDIGGVAAEMGISVEAAMEGMAEGMTDGLKAVARKQIQYLSGLEAMLVALAALEAVGKVDLGIEISIDIEGDNDFSGNIVDFYDWYSGIPDTQKKEAILQLRTQLNEAWGGTDEGKALIEGLIGDGDFSAFDDVVVEMMSKYGEAIESGQYPQIGEAIVKMLGSPEGAIQALAGHLGEGFDLASFFKMDDLGNILGFAEGITGENIADALFTAITSGLENVNWDNLMGNRNVALSEWMAKSGAGEITIPLEDGTTYKIVQDPESTNFQLVGADGKTPITSEAWSSMSDEIKSQILSQISAGIGENVTDIIFGEDGGISFKFDESSTEGINKINTNFLTAAAAAQSLNTAISGINEGIAAFTAGTEFQTLANQINYAAQAAERLAAALGIQIQAPQMPEFDLSNYNPTQGTVPFGTGMGQIDASQFMTPQQILGMGMGPLSAQGLNDALNADYFSSMPPVEIPIKPTAEGGGDFAAGLTNQFKQKPIELPAVAKLEKGQQSTLEADSSALEKTTEQAKAKLEEVGNMTPVATVDADTTTADQKLTDTKAKADEVQDSDPSVDVSETGSDDTITKLTEVSGAASSVPDVSISVSVSGVDKAIGEINRIKAAAGSSSWSGMVNSINPSGRALAEGTVDRLHVGAKLANKTLVGELGPELAVYNGQYHLLGSGGAEFVKLPKDALVFNHLQTRGIINGQMNGARAKVYGNRAQGVSERMWGSAMATGNVTGPALASGIAGALAAVRRAKSVWQGLLNTLSAADLMGAGGGGGGGGGDDNSLKAHIEDLQEWYNLSRQIAKIEQEINTLLAKRKNITDGHEYLKNLRETQKLLTQQVATQQVLVKYQQAQLEAQAQHINTHSIWSQFLTVGEDGLLQYKDGNETNGGKGSLSVLQQMNQMSGEEQVAFLAKLGYSYTDNDGKKLEGEELVAKFFEELQKQIDDYDALADAVAEAEEAMADLEAEIAEIEREIRDNEIELGQNIYDVMVAAWEENIKNLKEQNELIKEANEAYANGIQEAIDAERQMYEQNRAISDREQLQRQLALLRRSGGSASEIADLESQLDDMLKDEYFANQEDALETIRDANERQVELMDQQVKLEEEALEYEKENGVIWTKVYEVMQGTDAEILSFLSGNDPGFFEKQKLEQEDMLTEWAKKIGIYTEERQRQNYIKELDTNSFNNALVSADGKTDYTSTYNKLDDSEKKTLKDLFERTYGDARIDGKSEAEALKLANEAVQKFLEDWKKAQDAASKPPSSNGGGSSGGSSGGNSSNSSGSSSKKADYHYIKVGNDFIGVNSSGSKSSIVSYIAKASGLSKEEVEKQLKTSKRYASGGLVNYTGPAWVDGSKSKPERILSAEQNKILEEGLAMNAGRSDKLREMFSNFAENLGASVRASISNIINRTSGSAITIQPGAVQLNIEQLNDKYDVDELFNDVADRLYSIASKASGRGVNRR